MPQVVNYAGVESAFKWTGLNTLNQAWSSITLPEGIVTSITIFWGGWGGTASGKHCLWNSSGTLLAQSATTTVAEGRGWRTFSIPDTYVTAGTYYVGIYCNPTQNRIFGQATTGTLYLKTNTGASPNGATGGSGDSGGMLPVKVDYEYAGRLKVKANGAWVTGTTSVKVDGSWKKAQRIWVKVDGTWIKTKIT